MENEQLYDFVAQRTARCKILVVGDVMLDKYYYGEVTRISPCLLYTSPSPRDS